MNLNKAILPTAVAIALGTSSFVASAALTSSATLDFNISNSYFAMDTNGDGDFNDENPTPIGSFNGIRIGSTQAASGSHAGFINGTESPNIDSPWTFFGNTGMHQTTSPITMIEDYGTYKELDMSGWSVTWNGLTSIPMVQTSAAIITCSTSSCSDSSSYTLDSTFHVNGSGFTTVGYLLHLEGHVSSVPVPAAAWLFGSGLVGLMSVARRRKV